MKKGELDVRMIISIVLVLALVLVVFLAVSHVIHQGENRTVSGVDRAGCSIVVSNACMDGEISSEELASSPDCLTGVSCK